MPSTHIAILMATYNGGRFLSQQLASIAGQNHEDWSLWISDDASTDDTLKIIGDFANTQPAGRVTLFHSAHRHPTRNFMSLMARPEIPDGVIAFADQDDVWLPEKLAHGLRVMAKTTEPDRPALYGARTIIVDDDLKRRGHSPLFRHPPGFANAIVQSIAGGNTMLLNGNAQALLRRAGPSLEVVTHDWWAYQLIAGAGGQVIYDTEPMLLYRQHDTNLIGSNSGARAQMVRLRAVMQNRFREWNDLNLSALDQCRDHLTAENAALLDHFRALRQHRGLRAFRELRKSGIYRQTRNGTRSLELAAFLGKL